jgi:hypothetical protein
VTLEISKEALRSPYGIEKVGNRHREHEPKLFQIGRENLLSLKGVAKAEHLSGLKPRKEELSCFVRETGGQIIFQPEPATILVPLTHERDPISLKEI